MPSLLSELCSLHYSLYGTQHPCHADGASDVVSLNLPSPTHVSYSDECCQICIYNVSIRVVSVVPVLGEVNERAMMIKYAQEAINEREFKLERHIGWMCVTGPLEQ